MSATMIGMTDRPIEPHRPTDGRPAVDADPEPTVDSSTAPTDNRSAVDDQEPWALKVGLTGALWILSTVASLMTSVGQVGFARWAGLTGLVVFGVPVILDMFDVVLLLLGYRQGRRKRSPYPLWILAAIVAGFGFYTNVVHAGHRAGLVFGAASAVTFISWLVKLRIDLTKYLVLIKHIPPGRPKFGKLALVAPRVALHAWTVTVRRRVTDGDTAVECAETWIVVHDDTLVALRTSGKRRRISRRLAKRTAWRTVFAMTGGPSIAMPRSAVVETVGVTIGSTDDQSAAVHSTTEPTAVEATEPRPIDREAPTIDRRPVADRAPRRPTIPRRPIERPTADHSAAAIANARLLREHYHPNGLPANYSYGQVRGDTGWSFERTKAAVDAYRDGADLGDKAEEPDRAGIPVGAAV